MDSDTKNALYSLAKALLALQSQISTLRDGHQSSLDGFEGATDTEKFHKAMEEFLKGISDGRR